MRARRCPLRFRTARIVIVARVTLSPISADTRTTKRASLFTLDQNTALEHSTVDNAEQKILDERVGLDK
jgi:hypothetical protein